MLYAIAHPDNVERLALVSPAPSWRAARIEFEARFRARSATPEIEAERRALRASGIRDRDLATYQRRLFELAVAGYFHDPSRVSELTPFRITERTQREVWESLGDYDIRPALRQLRLPALVVHGDDDPIPVESARETANCLSAEWCLLRNCGHVPIVFG